MQKNLVLAIVLSSIVYIFWFSVIEKRPTVNQTQVATQTTVQKPVANAPITQATAIKIEKFENQSANIPSTIEKIKIEKSEYSISSKGAQITGLKYEGPVSPAELIINPSSSLLGSFENYDFKLVEKKAYNLKFESRTNKNFLIKKNYNFDKNSGINTLEISISNLNSQSIIFEEWQLKMGPGLGTVKNEEKENTKLWQAKYTVLEKNRKHPVINKIKENTSIDDWTWVGIDNRYFLAAIIGNDDLTGNTSILYDNPKINDKKTPFISIPFAASSLRPNETKTWRIDFYIGPKDYAKLEALGHGLDRSVDFGFFSPLAKLANSSLMYFFNMTGNYGFAIIILSVILQILMFPLSWKSYKAMNMMRVLQPELQLLQKKYKDDPKRLNTEVMQMYKKHGTNPLGGCLPMLLQIPIFFALFTALRNNWALHGADFIFWITDLSSKDPYYVLPITMGLIMLLQQHVTPQAAGGDKGQMAVMKWMPVIFTFMFLYFPAGLVLYWLINSVSSFTQQLYLQKQSKDA